MTAGATSGRPRQRGHRRRAGDHALHEVLGRDRHEHRPPRRRHRELASALHGVRQECAPVQGEAPLHARLHQPGGAAGVGEQAKPLPADLRPGRLGEADRFAGQNDHRDALVQRRPHDHGRVQRAHGRVEANGRELPGRLRVAHRHRHRGFLVARRDVLRKVAVRVRRGERLPDRRPVGAGRREDALDPHRTEAAQQRFRAARCGAQRIPSRRAAFPPQIIASSAGDPPQRSTKPAGSFSPTG